MKFKLALTNGPADGEDILFAEWHPKGNAVICGGKDFCIYLLNGMTGDFLACLSGHEEEVTSAKFTTNGKLVVSASRDCSLRTWSPIKQECVNVIKVKGKLADFHAAAINCFELHPDPTQAFCISGDLDGQVFYSNYITGEIGGKLGEHAGSVESFAFCKAPNSHFAVSCGIDSKINIYNVKDLKLRQTVTYQATGGFTKVLFSLVDPNMLYASSTNGDIIIVDVRNGTICRTYKGHAAPINDFVEVPEHKLLVTVGDDFVCNVYDLSEEPKSMKVAREKAKKEIDLA